MSGNLQQPLRLIYGCKVLGDFNDTQSSTALSLVMGLEDEEGSELVLSEEHLSDLDRERLRQRLERGWGGEVWVRYLAPKHRAIALDAATGKERYAVPLGAYAGASAATYATS